MKYRFPRDRGVKPSRLIWVTDNVTLEVPEIPSGLVKERVAVPRGRAKIPKVRNYKEQDPEQNECGSWPYQRL